MPSKHLIIETYFNERKQNFYYLMLPNVTEDGFYRSVRSFNGFFNGTRDPKANVTEIRQFTCTYEYEIKFRKEFFKDVDWDNLKTFDSIWSFYEFIGYNYKTRKYASGEVLRVWNGIHFVIPKRKSK